MSATSRRELAVMNKQLPSRVHHEGLHGAEEGAGFGRCHPSSKETFAKILLLLWAASLSGYPQPVVRPRLLCEQSVLCFRALSPAPGPHMLCPGGAGQRQGSICDRRGMGRRDMLGHKEEMSSSCGLHMALGVGMSAVV